MSNTTSPETFAPQFLCEPPPLIGDARRFFWYENLHLARRLWLERVDPATVDLENWQSDCGTFACFGGHLATWPEFQLMGVYPNIYEAPAIGYPATSGHGVALQLFGDADLFDQDREYTKSHYEVILDRIDARLDFLESATDIKRVNSETRSK